jgi:hypothetical protein
VRSLIDFLESQITQAVAGSDTDKVLTFYITGAVSFLLAYTFSLKSKTGGIMDITSLIIFLAIGALAGLLET